MMLRRLILMLLALLLLLPAASAEAPISLGEPLSDVYTWPENVPEAEALYIYRYAYPQIAGDSDLALHINSVFTYAVEDALGFEVPMLASEMQPGDPQKLVEIGYDVTCLNADYFSVRITKKVMAKGESTEVVSGYIFALTGNAAGQAVNLPVLLGLLDAKETDEWLQTRQTNKADKLVRELVWARIKENPDDAFHFYDDLSFEELEAGFYPEVDFYLTEKGEPCFYFQPGVIAPEEEGFPVFVITIWELLDEL